MADFLVTADLVVAASVLIKGTSGFFAAPGFFAVAGFFATPDFFAAVVAAFFTATTLVLRGSAAKVFFAGVFFADAVNVALGSFGLPAALLTVLGVAGFFAGGLAFGSAMLFTSMILG
ncbi:MAG: hypothetical protein ABI479_10710 [Gallionella sp.]